MPSTYDIFRASNRTSLVKGEKIVEKSVICPAGCVPHQLQLDQLGGFLGEEVEDVVPVIDRHPDDLVEVSDEVSDCLTPLAIDQAEMVQGVSIQERQ